jgi:putative FmdB family regulatory protein
MPMYPFQCPECKRQAEELRKMTEMNEPKQCLCGAYMQRTVAKSAFTFTDGGHKAEYGKHGPRKHYK